MDLSFFLFSFIKFITVFSRFFKLLFWFLNANVVIVDLLLFELSSPTFWIGFSNSNGILKKIKNFLYSKLSIEVKDLFEFCFAGVKLLIEFLFIFLILFRIEELLISPLYFWILWKTLVMLWKSFFEKSVKFSTLGFFG